MSDKICRENQNPQFRFNNSFSENRGVREIMWENVSRAGQATDDDMAHTHCMLDT